ncbi:MAG: zf-HC2 domain-containing protein, partial [Polyangiaceae bacterium]|nr:zf-HC2 domain-containing protein [Polyangiaceae bacterium]
MSCRLVQRHVGAYVDGELDPGSMLDFERHIDVCAQCQEHVAFERAYREMVDSSLGGSAAPEHLKNNVRLALDRIDASATKGARLTRIPWRQVVPLAVAAGVLLALGGVVGGVP